MADKNQSIIDLLKRVNREGLVVLPPVAMTPDESELIGNAVFVNPDQPLMHYMKLEFFMQMLVAEQLHMRRLDTFDDDPVEGLYPEANKHELSSFDAAWLKQIGTSKDVSGLVASNKHQREETYIHCWFGGISESKLMWEKYGGTPVDFSVVQYPYIIPAGLGKRVEGNISLSAAVLNNAYVGEKGKVEFRILDFEIVTE